MGLDMYLQKRHGFWQHAGGKVETVVSTDNSIRPERVKYIIEDIMYWRKANHIHGWFVQNVQSGEDDCRCYDLDRGQLVELLTVIDAVIADRSKAAELLPTMEGFFFGSTDYDDDYFDELHRTARVLREETGVDALVGENTDYIYHSSW